VHPSFLPHTCHMSCPSQNYSFSLLIIINKVNE
jgi:hypothetical protein